VARSEAFAQMIELVAKHGLRLKKPSYHGIRVRYLKEYLEAHRVSWKKTRCTLMTDS